MMRAVALPLSFLLAACLLAQDELPVDPDQPLEIEPPLLIQETPNRSQSPSAPDVAGEPEPERIQIALEEAKKSAAASERLYKRGVLAKVEAENRALKVIRLESNLANAKLEVAKQAAATQQSRFDSKEISQIELEAAKSALSAAINEAALATARRQQAELEAAFLNLSRRKKLLALGIGRKSDVTRAEEQVSELQQKQN